MAPWAGPDCNVKQAEQLPITLARTWGETMGPFSEESKTLEEVAYKITQ